MQRFVRTFQLGSPSLLGSFVQPSLPLRMSDDSTQTRAGRQDGTYLETIFGGLTLAGGFSLEFQPQGTF